MARRRKSTPLNRHVLLCATGAVTCGDPNDLSLDSADILEQAYVNPNRSGANGTGPLNNFEHVIEAFDYDDFPDQMGSIPMSTSVVNGVYAISIPITTPQGRA